MSWPDRVAIWLVDALRQLEQPLIRWVKRRDVRRCERGSHAPGPSGRYCTRCGGRLR